MLVGVKKFSDNSIEEVEIPYTNRFEYNRTCYETSIYSYEMKMKQQYSVWVFQNEANHVVHSRSTPKKMMACFFDCTEHVATILLEN